MTDQDELLTFIRVRIEEVRRLTRSLSVSEALNVQASVDQLDRLADSVDSVVTFVNYNPQNPLSLPIMKKIANNWSYHSDFNPSWRSQNAV